MLATTGTMSKKAALVGPLRPAFLHVVLCSASAIVSALLTTVFLRWRPSKHRKDLAELMGAHSLALECARQETDKKADELHKLEKQLGWLQQQLEQTSQQLKEANMDKVKYANQLDSAVCEASERYAAADMLSQKLLESGVRCDNTQRRLTAMEQERNALRGEVEASSREIQQLRGSLVDAKERQQNTEDKYMTLQAEHAEVCRKMREMEQHFSSLSTAKTRTERELQEKVAALDRELTSTRRRRDEAQAEVRKYKEKAEIVAKKIEATGGAVMQMSAELEGMKRQREQMASKLKAEEGYRQRAEAQLQVAASKIRELEGKLSFRNDDIRRLQAGQSRG